MIGTGLYTISEIVVFTRIPNLLIRHWLRFPWIKS